MPLLVRKLQKKSFKFSDELSAQVSEVTGFEGEQTNISMASPAQC